MVDEENVKQQLAGKFSYLGDKINIKRVRRIFADVPMEKFEEVFNYAIDKLGFVILCTITGLDEGNNLGFIYHIARENGMILSLHTTAPKDKPVIKTISGRFPAADAYERELVDLLGAKVEGLPEGFRYPLPDDWPANQYPLRKDWSPEDLKKKEVTKNA